MDSDGGGRDHLMVQCLGCLSGRDEHPVVHFHFLVNLEARGIREIAAAGIAAILQEIVVVVVESEGEVVDVTEVVVLAGFSCKLGCQ